jgi:hypothetical protein
MVKDSEKECNMRKSRACGVLALSRAVCNYQSIKDGATLIQMLQQKAEQTPQHTKPIKLTTFQH